MCWKLFRAKFFPHQKFPTQQKVFLEDGRVFFSSNLGRQDVDNLKSIGSLPMDPLSNGNGIRILLCNLRRKITCHHHFTMASEWRWRRFPVRNPISDVETSLLNKFHFAIFKLSLPSQRNLQSWEFSIWKNILHSLPSLNIWWKEWFPSEICRLKETAPFVSLRSRRCLQSEANWICGSFDILPSQTRIKGKKVNVVNK